MDISFLVKGMASQPQKEMLVGSFGAWTFAHIHSELDNARKSLDAAQISAGNIVAVRADYSPQSIALLLALIERDCIFVPLSFAVKQVERCLEVAEVEYLFDLGQETPVVQKLDRTVQHPMLLKLRASKTAGLVLFSSGTTGEPKAILHEWRFLLQKFQKPGKVLRTLSFLHFDHWGGLNTILHAIANAGTIVAADSHAVDAVCAAIEKYKVELLPTSPTFLNLLLLSRKYTDYDLSSLQIISYGTEPMAQSVLDALHQAFPHLKLKQTFGLSELGVFGTRSESSDSLWLKVGGEGVETKIVDDILYIRSASAMVGYLNAPSPFDAEGWFCTQDRVEQRPDGYIKILGRITDIINVGGEKVYPIDVESELLRCGGVLDARVFGERNPLMGNVVMAEIAVAPEHNNREFVKVLREFCASRMERYKIPVKFRLVEGTLYSDRLKKKR